MRLFFFTFVIILVDQLAKQWVLGLDDLPWWLVDGRVGFRLSYNTGVAFSVPIAWWLVIVMSVAIIIGLLWYFFRYLNGSWLAIIAIGLIVGGAIGNIIDRFVIGAVVDFIQMYSYPIFNLADVFIFTGVVVLVVFHSRLQVR